MDVDEALVHRIGRGDAQAFDVLYGRHGPEVFRFAYGMSGARLMAEDCTQEVFLSVWQDSSGYRSGAGSVRAWLLGIARHKMIDRFRRQSRVELGLDVTALADAAAPAADQYARRRQRIDRVRCAIVALPLRYREVVVLCELEEMSYVEAAELIGCPVGTVRSRLHRAREQLAVKLRPGSDEAACPAERASGECR